MCHGLLREDLKCGPNVGFAPQVRTGSFLRCRAPDAKDELAELTLLLDVSKQLIDIEVPAAPSIADFTS